MRPQGTSDLGQRLGLAGIAALTGGWFTVSWRVMGKPFVDAVGETVGGVSVVLLGLAVISAARQSRS